MTDFSQLLSKTQRITGEVAPTSVGWASENSKTPPELRKVPVEKVNIEARSRVVLLTDPKSPGADRYRFLRMRLREFRELAGVRTLLITSPQPEDGKSTTAINLATTLAEGGKRTVLLIEADLHRPSIPSKLGLKQGFGLAECLERGLDPLTQLQHLDPLNWYLLQAGKAQTDPAELIQSDLFSVVIQRLSHYFDWILVDTPPVLPLSDGVTLSRYLDASLLVVRADKTPRHAVGQALAKLGDKHVLGIVLNGAEQLNRLYSQYAGITAASDLTGTS